VKDFNDGAYSMKDSEALAAISKAKAKGHLPSDVKKLARPEDRNAQLLGAIYEAYMDALKEHNSLDFDDLLLFGVKLLKAERQATSWCQHVLVDEL